MKHKLTLVTSVLLLSISIHSQTANPPFGPPSGKTWQVVDQLTDNFSSFDGNKWVKRNHDTGPEGHRWAGRKPGKIYASQSSVVNGKLRITATAAYNPGNAQTNCDFWLKTGFVYSKAKAGPGYYTECSMRASDLSMASSFWLKLGTRNNQEIDVTETYGNGRNTRFWDDKIRTNTHIFLNGDNATNPKPITVNYKPKDRFHSVGMFWKTATQMDIYVDGTYKISMKTKNGLKIEESLRLIFDMEAFVPACGSGPGAPDYDHVRPNNPTRRNYMEVDWVKTWRPVDSGGGGGGDNSDTQFQYDVGTDTSVVWPGYTRLSNTTRAGNFGWANTNDIGSRDRGAARGRNNINRDINFSSQTRFFTQNLSNGNWNVLITFGDTYARRNMNVAAEGQNKLTNINTNSGQYLSRSFDVNVDDGKLDLRFSVGSGGDVWSITRIWIRKSGTNGVRLVASKELTLENSDRTTEVLYPNPAKGVLNVSINPYEDYESLAVINMLGQVQIKKSLINNDFLYQIDISRLEKGMYFVVLNGKEGRKSLKFVKK